MLSEVRPACDIASARPAAEAGAARLVPPIGIHSSSLSKTQNPVLGSARLAMSGTARPEQAETPTCRAGATNRELQPPPLPPQVVLV